MHPDLQRLARADAIDRERRRVTRARDALQQGHVEARDAVVAAEAGLEDAEQALQQAREEERALNRKLHQYRQRRDSAVRILESGAGDPDSAQRQLDQCDQILDQTETELLELMERQDTLQAARDRAVGTLDAAKQALARLDAETPPRVAELQADLERMASERDAELAALDALTRDRYLELLRRKGNAVAPIDGGACQSCRMVVQAQHLADIKRGLIVPCRGCHRWLVPE